MDSQASSTDCLGVHERAQALEQLPVEIVCMILKQIDCSSDLLNATWGNPTLFRATKKFESEITTAILRNQFSIDELYPLNLAVATVTDDTIDLDEFEDFKTHGKLPAGQRLLLAKAIRKTTNITRCRDIENFNLVQSQMCDRFFENGLPAIPEDGSSDGDDTNSEEEGREPPTASERLRFLQAVCNLEMLRKLMDCEYTFGMCKSDDRHERQMGHIDIMTDIFSQHDWLQMMSVVYFIRKNMRPYIKHILINTIGQLDPDNAAHRPDIPLLIRLLTRFLHREAHSWDLDSEICYLLSLGVETCWKIISEPYHPRHLHYLTERPETSSTFVEPNIYYWVPVNPADYIEGKSYWGSENFGLLDSLRADAARVLPANGLGPSAIWNYQTMFLLSYAKESALYFADERRTDAIRSEHFPDVYPY